MSHLGNTVPPTTTFTYRYLMTFGTSMSCLFQSNYVNSMGLFQRFSLFKHISIGNGVKERIPLPNRVKKYSVKKIKDIVVFFRGFSSELSVRINSCLQDKNMLQYKENSCHLIFKVICLFCFSCIRLTALI